MILKKFLNFWKSEPRDSYKNNSYKRKREFLSTTFYDLKVTLGYIGESPETFMSKYAHEV